MIRLTRLNHQPIAINPDHIAYVDANPDTTILLLGGDRIIVRESLDALIQAVVDFRRAIRMHPLDEADALLHEDLNAPRPRSVRMDDVTGDAPRAPWPAAANGWEGR